MNDVSCGGLNFDLFYHGSAHLRVKTHKLVAQNNEGNGMGGLNDDDEKTSKTNLTSVESGVGRNDGFWLGITQ